MSARSIRMHDRLSRPSSGEPTRPGIRLRISDRRRCEQHMARGLQVGRQAGACTSVVGPTETIVIGQSGQSASSRRRSASGDAVEGLELLLRRRCRRRGTSSGSRARPAGPSAARCGGPSGRAPCSWPGSALPRSTPSRDQRRGRPRRSGRGWPGSTSGSQLRKVKNAPAWL